MCLMAQPNKISSVGAIRLAHGYWPMFRAIMNSKGRAWFERWIERTYKAMEK